MGGQVTFTPTHVPLKSLLPVLQAPGRSFPVPKSGITKLSGTPQQETKRHRRWQAANFSSSLSLFSIFFFQLDEWLEWGPDTRVRSALHQLGRTRVRAGSWLSLSALHTARQGLVAEGCGYTWMQVCSQEAGRRWR